MEHLAHVLMLMYKTVGRFPSHEAPSHERSLAINADATANATAESATEPADTAAAAAAAAAVAAAATVAEPTGPPAADAAVDFIYVLRVFNS